ncbi:PLP-dependent transferase [Geopsychrobacter electrodiphilus]|uniref:PLP-dependent transferase n=1 Tax=Geopsychrobacter electrodiphilus TaxID=225196 RepID=UPI000377AE8C|nr:PLP-dependent transferase [Geopsychrobacter electrodiphilus]
MAEQKYPPGIQAYIERGQQMAATEAKQRTLMRRKRFDTIAVHGIYGLEATLAHQGSINEPAFLSSAQHFENSDHMEAALAYLMPSWAYSRIANPTLHYLEETLALLEGYGFPGEVSCCVTASGMSAIFLATNPFLVEEGQGPINCVVSSKCYGGSFMLFNERYAKERGIDVRWVKDPLDLGEWENLVDEQTRFLFGEMPSNPGLSVFDVCAVAQLAHQNGIPLIVDSTVATPALLRPLCLGADIVVHSVSKSMNTGGLTIAGAVIARHQILSLVGPDELKENFALYLKLLPGRDFGPALNPLSALFVLNDLHTLRSKMDLLSQNCLQVALFLDQHSEVTAVYYPGLPADSGHVVASRLMRLVDCESDSDTVSQRYGHLLSFRVRGGAAAARLFFDNLQMILRATDLGRIKSIATIPAISTHQQQGEQGRSLADIPVDLVRLNVGGEHPEDIIQDLDQALRGLRQS